MKRVHVLLCVVAIAFAVPAQTPTLSVSQVPPANVQLLWPSNFAGWQLTFATNLSPANWQAITQAPVISGTSLMVSLSLTNANGFFRLQKTNGGGGACTFQATPPQISSGGSSSLTWCPEAGTTYRISPGPGVVAGNNLTVSPMVTTVYTLTASNATAIKTNFATVVVGPCGWLQVSNWNVEMDFSYHFSKSTTDYNFSINHYAFVTFHLFRLASSTGTDAYYFGFAVDDPHFDEASIDDEEDDMTAAPMVFTTKESNPLFTKPDHTVCSMSLHLTCSTYDFSYNILAPVTETTAFGTFMQTDGVGTGAVAARPLSTTTNVISSNADILAMYPPVAGDYFTPSSDVGKDLFTTGAAASGAAGTAAVFWNFIPAP